MNCSGEFYACEHLRTTLLRSGCSYNVEMSVMPGKTKENSWNESWMRSQCVPVRREYGQIGFHATSYTIKDDQACGRMEMHSFIWRLSWKIFVLSFLVFFSYNLCWALLILTNAIRVIFGFSSQASDLCLYLVFMPCYRTLMVVTCIWI